MPVNKYFSNFSPSKINEQRLFEDLVVESIKMHGHDVWYLPRESWDETDQLFGENVNSRFERAYQIEVYIANVDGWLGDGDFFSKLGLEVRDNANFILSRRSFDKIIPNSIAIRPREGDLLYIPLMNKIFEIKFVEEDNMYFSAGNRLPYVYELRCEAFRYSNEIIDVGLDEIDSIDTDTSYTVQMTVSGSGNFIIGETVYQGSNLAYSTMHAVVSDWDSANNKLNLIEIVGDISGNANLVGANSGTTYSVTLTDTIGDYVWYDQWDNKQIQDEANTFVDLSEVNVFGMP